MTIRRLTGLEILDSRGCPTVRATCALASGTTGTASVPSGASTGAAEAVELRDGDPARYAGRGCRKAVANINHELNRALSGRADIATQADVDRVLAELDGTPNKARLGANAILAVSLAFARAQAVERQVPLYQHFADMLGTPIRHLPRLTINLFSGGKHAGGQVPIQDVLIVPRSARTIDEALVMASAVYAQAVALIRREYDMRWLTADEGGLAPPAASAEQLFEHAVTCIRAAGFEPGRDVALAVDVASSHFYRDGRYDLGPTPMTAQQMIAHVSGWVERFPIISIEDGLAEDDWEDWPDLCAALAGKALILGDDLLCTNPQRIQRGIEARACNALLLKANQIGTLSEALEAYRLARAANWSVTLSVRSGDTEDDWLADLAVGWTADYTKAGSLTQSERLSKYNRLLAIETERRGNMS
ncbi:MAG: phosphopyruvate hydratase [Planctomycetia bacterium]|nr:phosphopyruvate hydratase [Planctomycetia bacterium]